MAHTEGTSPGLGQVPVLRGRRGFTGRSKVAPRWLVGCQSQWCDGQVRQGRTSRSRGLRTAVALRLRGTRVLKLQRWPPRAPPAPWTGASGAPQHHAGARSSWAEGWFEEGPPLGGLSTQGDPDTQAHTSGRGLCQPAGRAWPLVRLWAAICCYKQLLRLPGQTPTPPPWRAGNLPTANESTGVGSKPNPSCSKQGHSLPAPGAHAGAWWLAPGSLGPVVGQEPLQVALNAQDRYIGSTGNELGVSAFPVASTS